MTAKTSEPVDDRERGARQTGIAKSTGYDPLVLALVALTFSTGLIDAVSYIGLGHVFVANMTGNVVLLGFAAAGVPGLSVSRSLVSLVAFVVGAAGGGRLETVMAAGHRRHWILGVGVAEAALIIAAAVTSFGFDIDAGTPADHLYAMIALTAITMGLRNATVRRLSVPDLTTTVLTLTLTGLAADSPLAGGNNPRVVRRLFSVGVLFGGAAIGAFLLLYGLALPLFVTAACVLGTTAAYASVAGSTEKG
ncbi:MAG: YoaK family protein [Candidatus Binatia bacterium]